MYFIQDHKTEYGQIYVPAEGATSLYYLFVTRNFNKKLAGQFQKDARISAIDNIQFIDASCPTEVIVDFAPNVLIVNRYNCPDKPKLKKIVKIRGKNELLGFTVYTSPTP